MQPPADTPEPLDPGPETQAQGQPLPSLSVAGVVVTKSQLMDALRIYLPGITDVSPLPDGQHFSILFRQDGHQHPQ